MDPGYLRLSLIEESLIRLEGLGWRAVYATNNGGLTTALGAGRSSAYGATNDIEEPVFASMAAGGGVLFLRGARHLYAIRGR